MFFHRSFSYELTHSIENYRLCVRNPLIRCSRLARRRISTKTLFAKYCSNFSSLKDWIACLMWNLIRGGRTVLSEYVKRNHSQNCTRVKEKNMSREWKRKNTLQRDKNIIHAWHNFCTIPSRHSAWILHF